MKMSELNEWGRIVKGVNTTVDVGPGEIKTQAAKFGNTVDKDGFPPTMTTVVKPKSTTVKHHSPVKESEQPRYTAAEWAIISGGHTLEETIIEPKKPGKLFTALTEGYKLQLERDTDVLVLHIKDNATGKRTEVRGKPGYETNGYDPKDPLHQLLDVVGKSANISELMNGEVVTINPKHPDAERALAATDRAYNEAFDTDVEWIKDFDDGDIKVFATKIDDAYIELTYKRMTNGDMYIAFSRGGRSSVTGEGSQNKIFGAVINHIQKFVATAKPQRVIFSAFKPRTGAFGAQDSTRSSLYRRMVQRFASQNGYDYDVEDTGNEDTFILKKIEAENLDEDVAWQNSVSKHIFDFEESELGTEEERFLLPISSSVLTRLGAKEVRATVFHVTGYENLDSMIKNQNSKKALSTFFHMDSGRFYSGIQGGGGLVFELDANILMAAPEDIETKVDNGGRRWIPMQFIARNDGEINTSGLYDDVPKLLATLLKKYTGKSYNYEEDDVYNQWKRLGKTLNSKRDGKTLNLLIKDFIDGIYGIYQKHKDQLMKLFRYHLADRTPMDDTIDWDEVIANEYKIKKIHILDSVTLKKNPQIMNSIKSTGIEYDLWSKGSQLGSHIKKTVDQEKSEYTAQQQKNNPNTKASSNFSFVKPKNGLWDESKIFNLATTGKLDLGNAISKLNPEEQEWAKLRWQQNLTMKDIGAKYNLTNSQAIQNYKPIHDKIRQYLGLKEARSFQPQQSPLQELVKEYLFFTSMGQAGAEDYAKSPESKDELKKVVNTLSQSNKNLQNLDNQKIEANRDKILNHIHDMMQYAIAQFREHSPERFEAKKKQINSVLTKYNAAASTNENFLGKIKGALGFGWNKIGDTVRGSVILDYLDSNDFYASQNLEKRIKSSKFKLIELDLETAKKYAGHTAKKANVRSMIDPDKEMHSRQWKLTHNSLIKSPPVLMSDGDILDGNHRIDRAIKLELPKIPVLIQVGKGIGENFLESKLTYSTPNFEHEWEEAERYPEFRKIGKAAWIELASKGKAVTIRSAKGINNTDAADPNSFASLDKTKQSRALDQLKSGRVEMPIVAVYPDGWKELVGGNTRLTAMLAQNSEATVWAFKVPDEILDENFADGKKEGNVISPPGNTVGLNVFEIPPEQREKLNGTVVYHQTKKLDKIMQSGGLRPRADVSGEREFALMTIKSGRDWRTPKGIFVSTKSGGWFGDEISFKIEPKDKIYRAYSDTGHLLIVNPVNADRFISAGPIEENFADGKKPGRKGLAKRSGVNTKASVSSLRKTAKNSSGEKQRMAHWLANMKAGKAKKK
jgi:hypothetical protein